MSNGGLDDAAQPGTGEVTGRALGLHPDVDCLAFTGSTEVGKLFQGYAGASNMKQVWPECGGKSANLVFADTEDLGQATRNAALGIFFNQGEVCSGHSRLLVERPIHDELVRLLTKEAANYQPGDPLDPASGMGALVSTEHASRVMDYVEKGADSAELVIGGNRVTIRGSNCFVEPTIFTGVDPSSVIAQEEIFGPVLAVIPFDTEDEAVEIANATPYGLAASLSTSSLRRVHRVAERLVAGTVSVNTVDAFCAWTPFGGVKASGHGRDLSLHALDKYTSLQTTWISL